MDFSSPTQELEMLVMMFAILDAACAEDVAHPHHPTFMNVGAFAVVAEEGWETQYVYFGPSVVVPVSERFVLVPNVVFETSPGSGAWGFAASVPLEFLLTQHIGLDIVPTVAQDTIGRETMVVLALGPGTTFFTSHHVSISFVAQGAFAPAHELWTFNPAINIAVPFP